MAEFVSAFHDMAAPEGFNHFFFISGGELAVENAMKTAFDWKARKNIERGIHNKGSQILHFQKAFHGRTGYTLSVTNTFDQNKTKYFPKFNWPRVGSPYMQFPLTAENQRNVEILEEQTYREIEEAFKNNPDDIAAILIEPIQGEGGDNHFRAEFFQMLRKIADEKEALLIFDEVQTGLGLTGKMWCTEHFGIMPDIICFGKKAQVAGIMANERIQEVESVFTVPSRINSTFGGNLVDMVRCRKYLEIITKENLLKNASEIGDYLLEGLIQLAGKYDHVNNVRGRGLMIAFDLPDSKTRNNYIDYLREEGCLVLACGEKSVRLRPPLNLKTSEADEGLSYFEMGFKKIS